MCACPQKGCDDCGFDRYLEYPKSAYQLKVCGHYSTINTVSIKGACMVLISRSIICDLILENRRYPHNFQNGFYLFYVFYRDRGMD